MRYKPVRWTPKEDAALRSVKSNKAAARLFPGRTVWNIKMRRQALGLTQTREPCWTKSEDKRLLKFALEPMSKLEKRFKNRTRQGIRTRRTALGFGAPLPEAQRPTTAFTNRSERKRERMASRSASSGLIQTTSPTFTRPRHARITTGSLAPLSF
jgi:hypothetical protein